MTRDRKHAFLDTLLAAQRLAFAPFIFKAVSAALHTGFLEAVARHSGGTAESYAEALEITPYAAAVMADILAAADVLTRSPEGTLSTTPVADCLLFDEMTRANFFFADDVNYVGLDKTLEALLEARPAGLAAFNPEWKTIYPHLPELPERARRAWFGFDHFHSDRAYEAALDVLVSVNPAWRTLVDIGGNTGRFTKAFLDRFPESSAYFVDLPVETEALLAREEIAPYAARIRTISIDWLTDSELEGTAGADLYWMSQFLDCFSESEAKTILERTRRAMRDGAALAVLEPLVDEQRHKAAELSLAASSLYFTVMANGRSRFFNGPALRKLFCEAGLRIVSEHPNLGISHTLFLLEKA